MNGQSLLMVTHILWTLYNGFPPKSPCSYEHFPFSSVDISDLPGLEASGRALTKTAGSMTGHFAVVHEKYGQWRVEFFFLMVRFFFVRNEFLLMLLMLFFSMARNHWWCLFRFIASAVCGMQSVRGWLRWCAWRRAGNCSPTWRKSSARPNWGFSCFFLWFMVYS